MWNSLVSRIAISVRSDARAARSVLSDAELAAPRAQRREHLVHLLADVVGEPLMLLEHLLAEVALALRQLLVDGAGARSCARAVSFSSLESRAVRVDAVVRSALS